MVARVRRSSDSRGLRTQPTPAVRRGSRAVPRVLPRQSPGRVLDLQRDAGNAAVAALVRVQRQDDEREAGTADKADVRLWDDMFILARKRMAAKDFSGAYKLFMRIYDDPKFTPADSPGVLLNLALIRHHDGDHRDALRYYGEALHVQEWTADDKRRILENVRAARLGKPPVEHESSQFTGKGEKPDKADVQLWDDMFLLARKYVAAKKYAEAEKLFRRIYDDPKFRTDNSPGVVLNLGLMRHWAGDFKSAVRLYAESMHTPEWDADARVEILKNVRLARLGKLPDQAAPQQQADSADDALWEDTFRLARKKIAVKDYGEAEKLLLQIYRDPKFSAKGNKGVLFNLGLVRHLTGDYAAALSWYDEGLHVPGISAKQRRLAAANVRAARLRKPPILTSA